MLLSTPDTFLLPEPLKHCFHQKSALQVQSQSKAQVRVVWVAAQLGTCPTIRGRCLNYKYFKVQMKPECRRGVEKIN